MDLLEQQTYLYGLPEYRKLDARYQKIAREILLNGLSFTAVCRPLGVNPSRAKRDVDLQKCFWAFNRSGTTQDEPRELTIYEQAAALEKEMESWPAEKLAEWHERMDREYPRDKNYPCRFCGKSCDRAIGLCPACCPECRCNASDCPRNPKCRENSKPAPPPRPGPARAADVYPVADYPSSRRQKRCRKCGAEATPRSIVCDNANCCGAIDFV